MNNFNKKKPNLNRYLATLAAENLVQSGVGESIGVEFDEGEWIVDVVEAKDNLPQTMDFYIGNVRVRVNSSQKAISWHSSQYSSVV